MAARVREAGDGGKPPMTSRLENAMQVLRASAGGSVHPNHPATIGQLCFNGHT